MLYSQTIIIILTKFEQYVQLLYIFIMYASICYRERKKKKYEREDNRYREKNVKMGQKEI